MKGQGPNGVSSKDTMAIVVTTAEKTKDGLTHRAQRFAQAHGWRYVPRAGKSLARLCLEYEAEGVFIFAQDGLTFYRSEGQAFRYTPGMAYLRIKRLVKGENDLMVEIARLRPGDTFFDATSGLGGDALVASFVVGSAGRVVAVEASYLLYALVKEGLKMWAEQTSASFWSKPSDSTIGVDHPLGKGITEATHRIEFLHGDHRQVLSKLPDRSVDTVYFDPMFERTVHASHGTVDTLRVLGDSTPIQDEAIEQALRVARRNVMIKERPGSPLFARYGFRLYARKASFTYGVREIL
ncbi:MAG: SAM-dependent methyltransferase [Candidatus Carbobacillus sp.]|nr:SAM-dependent methyltransferase [Candidatus Carbobacillus sp.]